MKMPNGYGSITKKSGNRRKPWVVRKTIGWNDKGQAIFEYIGYYETKSQALQALADYNASPFSSDKNITMSELYDLFSKEHYENISESNIKGYKASWKLCESISAMKVPDVKLRHLQDVVDNSGKNSPTLRKLKVLLNGMFEYGIKNELVDPAKMDMIKYVDISKAGNPNALNRTYFTTEDVKKIWAAEPTNDFISIILILIYTGLRIGELIDLRKDDVHLSERWFYVRESKTDSGIREVPIAEKVVSFFERWLARDSEYLICNTKNGKFEYHTLKDNYWFPIMAELGFDKRHTPHSTRYTCISLMTIAGVDERILKKIVGHKGQNVTEAVYTHIELPAKLEAINRI